MNLDDLDVFTPQPAVVPTPRRHRHRWQPIAGVSGIHHVCTAHATPVIRDETAARRGKSARNRGNDAERGIAKRWGGERRGMYGGAEDVIVAGLWVIQSKHGASYWPKRLVSALDALPRTEGRIPLVVVGDGSPGRHVRRLVIVDERDWLALHGPTGVDE